MQMLTTPDGAKIFQGNYDAMRGEACGFREASDGVTRCLPTNMGFSFGYYADSACTVPAMFQPCGAAPKYLARVTTTAGCSSTTQVFALNPTSIGQSYYVISGSSCQQFSLPAGYAVYAAAGSEVPPASFQSATLGVE